MGVWVRWAPRVARPCQGLSLRAAFGEVRAHCCVCALSRLGLCRRQAISRLCGLMPSAVVFVCTLLVACEATASSTVAALYSNRTSGASREALENAFKEVYDHFAGTFDTSLYERFASEINGSLEQYRQSSAYNAYALYPTAPHCDRGVAAPASATPVGGVSAYPGGVVGRVFGFDFGKELLDLSEKANGPASAGLIAPMALTRQALSTGMGLVQSSIAAMLHVVPPLVPPPLWNNQPMTCVPMASGHNCFGAVAYPITMADFVLADVQYCSLLPWLAV